MVIISDTSPIANLIQIEKLELLQLVLGNVIIPTEVDNEIRALEKFGIDITPYISATWIEVQSPKNYSAVQTLMLELDKGEAEAIILAKELKAGFLLIDERMGTKKAKEQGLKTIGLTGVILKSKKHSP